EAETGRPFYGPSGQVLDEMLDSIGLRRSDVYLTNVLHDRTPGNRDPSPEEIAYYEPFVARQLEIVQPEVIATLGRFAMDYILKKYDLPEKRGKISFLHGKPLKAAETYGEVHILPLYHPAVVLYTASKREVLEKDFEKLKMYI
ncbi:MAG TPA: uracil-DNA glycosylase, partial [Aggregatilineales bacterium]|nr:uracil-DNA glycosylase [Aggregatilineales bacterium]